VNTELKTKMDPFICGFCELFNTLDCPSFEKQPWYDSDSCDFFELSQDAYNTEDFMKKLIRENQNGND